jgi:hypothetical protein
MNFCARKRLDGDPQPENYTRGNPSQPRNHVGDTPGREESSSMTYSPSQTDERHAANAKVTEYNRRHWRQILANAPQLLRYIS